MSSLYLSLSHTHTNMCYMYPVLLSTGIVIGANIGHCRRRRRRPYVSVCRLKWIERRDMAYDHTIDQMTVSILNTTERKGNETVLKLNHHWFIDYNDRLIFDSIQ